MTTRRPPPTDHERTLFQTKAGVVRAEVRGPRIGWRRRTIRFYRLLPSASRPGGWDRVGSFRPEDLASLGKCLSAVAAWCREDADEPFTRSSSAGPGASRGSPRRR